MTDVMPDVRSSVLPGADLPGADLPDAAPPGVAVPGVALPRALREAGGTDAFAAFYAETVGPLGGYAFQLVRDADLAADIVQEAFTRLLGRWVAIRTPRPYVFHIATNLARDAWATRQRTAAVVLDLVGIRPAMTSPASDPSVWDAVERLPRRHREVVLLFYYADLPLTDVAAAVRRPAGTVKRLLNEARTHLAETLGGPQ